MVNFCWCIDDVLWGMLVRGQRMCLRWFTWWTSVVFNGLGLVMRNVGAGHVRMLLFCYVHVWQ